jgi:hypothetical protein
MCTCGPHPGPCIVGCTFTIRHVGIYDASRDDTMRLVTYRIPDLYISGIYIYIYIYPVYTYTGYIQSQYATCACACVRARARACVCTGPYQRRICAAQARGWLGVGYLASI